ncbi:MAG TPA: M13 family metallopeptidase N-terminal domain-containing protein, partial [Gammaproteobacteria bacterium]|nr:M13 family metallopeptidase N-terminal domain-containing protein [Gammaproteobacteria bacterium]
MPRFTSTLIAAAVCACTAAAASAATGTPDAGQSHSGVDLAGIDHSVKPGDDFFKYANGHWLKTAEIPADRSSIGTFYKIYKRTRGRIADIIQHAADADPAPGSEARKIADYYAAYMNTQAIEKHGLAPLESKLDAINSIDSRDDLAMVLGHRLRQDVDPVNATDFHTDHLFGLFVAQGLTDPSHNIAYLLQGGLTLPSRDYYLSDNETMAGYRDKYKDYIEAILKQAGIEDASAAAKRVFDLEMKIAQAHASLVESQNVHHANNLWPLDDFAQKAPGLNWDAYFKAAGLADQKHIDVWQPEAISKLSKLVANAPLESWKALLTFHTLDRHASLLPKKFANLAFEFHGHTLSGVPQQEARWKRGVEATSHALGFAVGKLYSDKYFPASAKQKAEQMVDNLIAAFGSRIGTLEWMTPATREKAK